MLGIDISSTAVKLLELSQEGDRYKVENYAITTLPNDTPIGDSDDRPSAIGDQIRAICDRLNIRSKQAAAAVPSSSVIVKTIPMPAGLADVKSGTEIPYQEGAASGATTTAFKEAVLKLDVVPNITPDDRILLDLVVNQDSVGDLVPSGSGGLIPTIDTTELMTQVLVGDGETIVLGGVFKHEDLVKVEKVPVLGDIPYLGSLFRSTANSQQKTETLIFITPRILGGALMK